MQWNFKHFILGCEQHEQNYLQASATHQVFKRYEENSTWCTYELCSLQNLFPSWVPQLEQHCSFPWEEGLLLNNVLCNSSYLIKVKEILLSSPPCLRTVAGLRVTDSPFLFADAC